MSFSKVCCSTTSSSTRARAHSLPLTCCFKKNGGKTVVEERRMYSRLRGLLFLNDGFTVNSHKTKLAEVESPVLDALRSYGRDLADRERLLGKLKTWHTTYDREERWDEPVGTYKDGDIWYVKWGVYDAPTPVEDDADEDRSQNAKSSKAKEKKKKRQQPGRAAREDQQMLREAANRKRRFEIGNLIRIKDGKNNWSHVPATILFFYTVSHENPRAGHVRVRLWNGEEASYPCLASIALKYDSEADSRYKEDLRRAQQRYPTKLEWKGYKGFTFHGFDSDLGWLNVQLCLKDGSPCTNSDLFKKLDLRVLEKQHGEANFTYMMDKDGKPVQATATASQGKWGGIYFYGSPLVGTYEIRLEVVPKETDDPEENAVNRRVAKSLGIPPKTYSIQVYPTVPVEIVAPKFLPAADWEDKNNRDEAATGRSKAKAKAKPKAAAKHRRAAGVQTLAVPLRKWSETWVPVPPISFELTGFKHKKLPLADVEALKAYFAFGAEAEIFSEGRASDPVVADLGVAQLEVVDGAATLTNLRLPASKISAPCDVCIHLFGWQNTKGKSTLLDFVVEDGSFVLEPPPRAQLPEELAVLRTPTLDDLFKGIAKYTQERSATPLKDTRYVLRARVVNPADVPRLRFVAPPVAINISVPKHMPALWPGDTPDLDGVTAQVVLKDGSPFTTASGSSSTSASASSSSSSQPVASPAPAVGTPVTLDKSCKGIELAKGADLVVDPATGTIALAGKLVVNANPGREITLALAMPGYPDVKCTPITLKTIGLMLDPSPPDDVGSAVVRIQSRTGSGASSLKSTIEVIAPVSTVLSSYGRADIFAQDPGEDFDIKRAAEQPFTDGKGNRLHANEDGTLQLLGGKLVAREVIEYAFAGNSLNVQLVPLVDMLVSLSDTKVALDCEARPLVVALRNAEKVPTGIFEDEYKKLGLRFRLSVTSAQAAQRRPKKKRRAGSAASSTPVSPLPSSSQAESGRLSLVWIGQGEDPEPQEYLDFVPGEANCVLNNESGKVSLKGWGISGEVPQSGRGCAQGGDCRRRRRRGGWCLASGPKAEPTRSVAEPGSRALPDSRG